MTSKISRKLVSVLVITALVGSVFALPLFDDGNAVSAASKKVKVKFKANGGKFVKQKVKNSKGKKVKTYLKTKKVTVKKKYGTLAKVKKTGYTFKGWYTKNTKGKKITAKSKVKTKKTHNLYARWAAKQYTVKFNANGGSAVADKKVTYNTAYGTLPTTTKAKNYFLGWYTAAGEKVTAETVYKTADNTTLTAKWAQVDPTNFSNFGKTIDQILDFYQEVDIRENPDKSNSFYMDQNQGNIYFFKGAKLVGTCIAYTEHGGILFPDCKDMTQAEFEAYLGVKGVKVQEELYSYDLGGIYLFVIFENDKFNDVNGVFISTVDYNTLMKINDSFNFGS